MFKKKLMSKSQKSHIDENYVIKGSKKIKAGDIDKVNRKKKRLNKILKLKVFSKQKQKLKLLIELLKRYKSGEYRVIPWRSVAAITFTLLYIINPLDIIPDVLPVLGYIDDMSVFMALYNLIDEDVEAFKEWKLNQLSDS
jgi:uncharacterized membrane protein YkvA (DUF1232 family)